MKKIKLKKIKALLIAMTMCLTVSSCNKKNEETINDNEAIVIFINDKALIYSGEYSMFVTEDYTGIGGTPFKYDEITIFSPGTPAVELKSLEDAIELATSIVGEENIIYIDYKDEDMKLTYVKRNK